MMSESTNLSLHLPENGLLTDSDEFVLLMEEVSRKLRKRFDTTMARFELSRTQWRALAYIYRTPGITQTELAKCLELERASIGHVVDQLEKMAFAQRRAAQGDRRVWELHLMPRAIEVLPQLRVEADGIYGLLLLTVSSTEIRTMRSSLVKMSGNLECVLGSAAVGADPA
jgi:DNA-binding MarR family transcriptional regulator